jgi:hypothetical protein
MKTAMLIVGFSVVLLVPLSTHAQTFTNLNFESADVAPTAPPTITYVPVGAALPGWTAFLGGVQLTQVGYNVPSTGTAGVSLFGPNWNSTDEGVFGIGIIDGNYSIVLQEGANPLNSTPLEVSASIEQNGTVPSTAESIQFKASEANPLSVSFNGNILLPVALSSGVSADGLPYTLYAANISAWANQPGELEFTATVNGSENYDVLDDISFSTTPVPSPEPSIVALTAIGGLLFGARKYFARRR